MGPETFGFVDFLTRAGFSLWQTLPLGPVNRSESPYQSTSAFAGNLALLAPEGANDMGGYAEFCESQRYWLEDYVLYRALRQRHKEQPWYAWPAELRHREPAALEAARRELAGALEEERRAQHRFFGGWRELKRYANAAGVYLFGDLPMFAAQDSADVWSHRELFCVDADGRMTEVAGAPPDAFAAEGQNWGCPQYRWEQCRAEAYCWWIERLRMQTDLFDVLRIDHFRGLEAGWFIPADAPSARHGRWQQVPGEELIGAVRAALGPVALIAEDLGHITPEVHALRHRLGLPGMHVLQFAFEGDEHNPYLPHNHAVHGVVYTGTHDNNTTLGWWRALDEHTRHRVLRYLDDPGDPMPWPLICAALASVCELAVLPLQDCLGLGAEARMNTPGTVEGNWRWRCPAGVLDHALAEKLRGRLELYGRV